MYEQFRNEALSYLSGFSAQDLKKIGDALDKASRHYTVTKQETALATREEAGLQLVKTYLVCKKIEGRSDLTIYNYGKALQIFFEDIRKAPGEVEANDIRVYLYRYKEARQVSDRSLDKIREYIRHFFSWAAAEGYIDKDPSLVVKAIKYEVKPRQAMTQVQLEYIRKACRTARERCIVEVLYSTGCRVSELGGIKLKDIDMVAGTVMLFGKGKKYRTGYLNAKAMVAVQEYLKSKKIEGEYLIQSERGGARMNKGGLERIVKGIVERAGLPAEITPHVFRHTTATQALHSGMPVQDIQHMLGHSSISTTMIYAETDETTVAANHAKYVV